MVKTMAKNFPKKVNRITIPRDIFQNDDASFSSEEDIKFNNLPTLDTKDIRDSGTSSKTPGEDLAGASIFGSLDLSDQPNGETEYLSQNKVTNTRYLVIAEIFFTVLPIIILIIVFLIKKRSDEIFSSPEWSVTAAIVFGQTIIKYISGILEKKIPTIYPRAVLIITILIMILIPSVIILTFVYGSYDLDKGLIYTQVILFLISLIAYYYISSNIEKAKTLF